VRLALRPYQMLFVGAYSRPNCGFGRVR
jgi:hypothetical protein